MSFFENIVDKAEDLAEEHNDKIDTGLDKLGDLIDEKTHGEHTEHIDTGVGKAKDLVEQLAEADDDAPA